jgi:hypothetical protein
MELAFGSLSDKVQPIGSIFEVDVKVGSSWIAILYSAGLEQTEGETKWLV